VETAPWFRVSRKAAVKVWSISVAGRDEMIGWSVHKARPKHSRWRTNSDGVRRNVTRHDRICTEHNTSTHVNAFSYYRSPADPAIVINDNRVLRATTCTLTFDTFGILFAY
jgi:hypothetical protein